MPGWSETDVLIRDAVREFVDKEVRPHIDALEAGTMEPYPIVRTMFSSFGIDAIATDALHKAWARLEQSDAASAAGEPQPERIHSGTDTGAGAGHAEASLPLLVAIELAGVCLGLLTSVGVSIGLTASTIRSRGTLRQQKRWLPGLVTFEKVGAWAITEPDAGSDAFGGMKTYVTRDGDGYRLNGLKTFITNGPDADVTVVYAKLDDGEQLDSRDRKVLTFVLDRGMPGFVQGKPFRKMGNHSSRTGELFFDNVYLEPDRLLGETEHHASGDGRDSARSGFALERVGIAAMSLGIINECLRLSLPYARNRVLWGQEIGRFQLIQLKLARMEIARLNVENMVLRAAEGLREGKLPTIAEASAMKLYSSEVATEVAMDAVQLFGGNGYMAEYRVEQLARDAKSLMIYAGSNEIQVTHIAKGLLRVRASSKR